MAIMKRFGARKVLTREWNRP